MTMMKPDNTKGRTVPPLVLRVICDGSSIRISTPQNARAHDFTYAKEIGMYTGRDAVGCQVNDESLRKDIELMGEEISKAISNFYSKHQNKLD